MSGSDLFVGVTSWNSAAFLEPCLVSLRRTAPDCEVCVVDNESVDDSVSVARRHGARVIVERWSQADALNRLSAASTRPLTLLIHADIVFLGDGWLERCAAQLGPRTGLVAPEDIGCGNYTRPWGVGMPESSFLLFDTKVLRGLRKTFWRRRWRIPVPRRRVDFYGEHITYNLPADLCRSGSGMSLMNVLPSRAAASAYFQPAGRFKYWEPEWGMHRYGLGNFYGIDGRVTHYHNWFDRLHVVPGAAAGDPLASYPPEGGVPVAFVADYTRRFLADWRAGCIELPEGLA